MTKNKLLKFKALNVHCAGLYSKKENNRIRQTESVLHQADQPCSNTWGSSSVVAGTTSSAAGLGAACTGAGAGLAAGAGIAAGAGLIPSFAMGLAPGGACLVCAW